MGNASSLVCLYVKLNRGVKSSSIGESRDCISSASYEYRKMSVRRGVQFVPFWNADCLLEDRHFLLVHTRTACTRLELNLMIMFALKCYNYKVAMLQRAFHSNKDVVDTFVKLLVSPEFLSCNEIKPHLQQHNYIKRHTQAKIMQLLIALLHILHFYK